MLDIKQHFITVKGHRIRLLEVNPGHKSVMVLIHGLGRFAEDWSKTLPVLAPHYRVLCFDLMGHGLSDKPLDFDYHTAHLAKVIKTALDQLGVTKIHLMGHSLGGCISLQFVTLYPDRVDKLIVVASAGLGREVLWLLRVTTLPWVGAWLSLPNPISAYFFCYLLLVIKANC